MIQVQTELNVADNTEPKEWNASKFWEVQKKICISRRYYCYKC